jgi:hypothetical protein
MQTFHKNLRYRLNINVNLYKNRVPIIWQGEAFTRSRQSITSDNTDFRCFRIGGFWTACIMQSFQLATSYIRQRVTKTILGTKNHRGFERISFRQRDVSFPRFSEVFRPTVGESPLTNLSRFSFRK